MNMENTEKKEKETEKPSWIPVPIEDGKTALDQVILILRKTAGLPAPWEVINAHLVVLKNVSTEWERLRKKDE